MSRDNDDQVDAGQQPPISVELWLGVVAGSVALLVAIGIIVVGWIAARQPTWFEVAVFIALTTFGIAVALFVDKAIPKNSRRFDDWRQPAVTAALLRSILLTGLGVPLAFATFLGREQQIPPPTPARPAILSLIEGRWGEDPACELVWDMTIIEGAGKRALEAQLVVHPDGVGPWTLLAEITAIEDLALTVSGLEPAEARGSTAVFTINPATERLAWDNRSKPGDVEEYRRCPA